MAYIATKDVNTAYGNFKKGDIVSDVLGEMYVQFEKVVGKDVKTEPIKNTKQEKNKKIKEEILTEVSSNVDIEISEPEVPEITE